MDKNDNKNLYLYKLNKYINKSKLFPENKLYIKKVKLYNILLNGSGRKGYVKLKNPAREEFENLFPKGFKYKYPILNFENKDKFDQLIITLKDINKEDINNLIFNFNKDITEEKISEKINELQKNILEQIDDELIVKEIEKIKKSKEVHKEIIDTIITTDKDNIDAYNNLIKLIKINNYERYLDVIEQFTKLDTTHLKSKIENLSKNDLVSIYKHSQKKLNGIMKFFFVYDLIKSENTKCKETLKCLKYKRKDLIINIFNSMKTELVSEVVKYFIYDYLIDKDNCIENVVIKQFITNLLIVFDDVANPKDFEFIQDTETKTREILNKKQKLLSYILTNYLFQKNILRDKDVIKFDTDRRSRDKDVTKFDTNSRSDVLDNKINMDKINKFIELNFKYPIVPGTPSDECFIMNLKKNTLSYVFKNEKDYLFWSDTIFINGISKIDTKKKQDFLTIVIKDDNQLCIEKNCKTYNKCTGTNNINLCGICNDCKKGNNCKNKNCSTQKCNQKDCENYSKCKEKCASENTTSSYKLGDAITTTYSYKVTDKKYLQIVYYEIYNSINVYYEVFTSKGFYKKECPCYEEKEEKCDNITDCVIEKTVVQNEEKYIYYCINDDKYNKKLEKN